MSYGEEDLWLEIGEGVRQAGETKAGGARPSRVGWRLRRGSLVLGGGIDPTTGSRRSSDLATDDGWVPLAGGVSISH